MTSIRIREYSDIDISQVHYEDPIKVKGSYMTMAKINGEDIYIQTPKITNVNGIIKTDTRAHLDLFFEKHHLKFYEFLSKMDDNNINQIFNNSKQWFNKDFPMDIVEDLYSSPLKHKNPPKFKLKLPLSKGEIDTEIYDGANNIIRHTYIPDDSQLICLLRFVGLKFLKEQVIAEWVPEQIKVCEIVPSSQSKYLISEADADADADADYDMDVDSDMDEFQISNNDIEEIDLDLNIDEPNYKDMFDNVQLELDEYKNNYRQKERELTEFKKNILNFVNK